MGASNPMWHSPLAIRRVLPPGTAGGGCLLRRCMTWTAAVAAPVEIARHHLDGFNAQRMKVGWLDIDQKAQLLRDWDP